jgi:hypothetical protein
MPQKTKSWVDKFTLKKGITSSKDIKTFIAVPKPIYVQGLCTLVALKV